MGQQPKDGSPSPRGSCGRPHYPFDVRAAAAADPALVATTGSGGGEGCFAADKENVGGPARCLAGPGRGKGVEAKQDQLRTWVKELGTRSPKKGVQQQ